MPTTNPTQFSGWGNNFRSLAHLFSAGSADDLQNFVNSIHSSRGALPIGLHRSYGDSALNSGGTLIDLSALHSIQIDPATGIAVVGAGVTISALERAALKHSLFPSKFFDQDL